MRDWLLRPRLIVGIIAIIGLLLLILVPGFTVTVLAILGAATIIGGCALFLWAAPELRKILADDGWGRDSGRFG